jgi:hypothetical protein
VAHPRADTGSRADANHAITTSISQTANAVDTDTAKATDSRRGNSPSRADPKRFSLALAPVVNPARGIYNRIYAVSGSTIHRNRG